MSLEIEKDNEEKSSKLIKIKGQNGRFKFVNKEGMHG